ncbi:hypothetical protein [uncultured Marinobacter sp.]|uniref:hypothetical protein n=1 Tax=uncultured Marinobacter sp. TaxID=187379 RepID=UPI0030D9AC3F
MPFSIAKGTAIRLNATKRLREMDHGDLVKSGFWVAQLCVVLATVIGVYLAASAGLRQALIFDSVTKQESNFYLRKSVYDELSDNVVVLRAYADDVLARNPPQSELLNQRPLLSRFVWEALRFSPTTLETPSAFLTGGRRFYLQVDDLIDKAESRTWAASHAAKRLTDLLDDTEQRLLPELKGSYEALGKQLTDYGVNLEVLKETL